MTEKKKPPEASSSSKVDEIVARIQAGPSALPDNGGVRYDAQGKRIGYVGVADDYMPVPRPTPMDGVRRPDSLDPSGEPIHPLYKSGYDEDTISRMSPDDVARMQIDLVKAGLISKSTSIRYGYPDNSTVGAYKALITYANRKGLTQIQALGELQANPEVKIGVGEDGQPYLADGGSTGPTRTVDKTITDPVFTDPVTARETLRSTLEDRLGRAPTADEYHSFRSMLSNSEAGQDVSTVVTRDDGQGNTTRHVKHSDTTTDPTPADLADQFSRQGKVGREANTRQAGVDYYGALQSLLGGQ